MQSSSRWSITLICVFALTALSAQSVLAAKGNVELRKQARTEQPVSNISKARKLRRGKTDKKPTPGVLNKKSALAQQGRLPTYGARNTKIKKVSIDIFRK